MAGIKERLIRAATVGETLAALHTPGTGVAQADGPRWKESVNPDGTIHVQFNELQAGDVVSFGGQPFVFRVNACGLEIGGTNMPPVVELVAGQDGVRIGADITNPIHVESKSTGATTLEDQITVGLAEEARQMKEIERESARMGIVPDAIDLLVAVVGNKNGEDVCQEVDRTRINPAPLRPLLAPKPVEVTAPTGTVPAVTGSQPDVVKCGTSKKLADAVNELQAAGFPGAFSQNPDFASIQDAMNRTANCTKSGVKIESTGVVWGSEDHFNTITGPELPLGDGAQWTFAQGWDGKDLNSVFALAVAPGMVVKVKGVAGSGWHVSQEDEARWVQMGQEVAARDHLPKPPDVIYIRSQADASKVAGRGWDVQTFSGK